MVQTLISLTRSLNGLAIPVVTGSITALFVLALATNSSVAQDEILLKSGRTLTGKIIEESATTTGSKKTYVVIRTETGGTYKLDQSKLIRKVEILDSIDREYQRRLAEMPETVDGNWRLQEWCSSQKNGKRRFAEELRFHRENVVALDPEHRLARQLLGYTRLENGQWVLGAQFALSRGYHKKGTGWAPILQEVIEARQEQSKINNGAKTKAYSIWKREFRKTQRPSPQLSARLNAICDPSSVMMLMKDAESSRDPDVRAMYIDAFASVNSKPSQSCLIFFAYRDPVSSVRELAISALSQPEFDHTFIVLRLAEGLRDTNNAFVNQAAFAIAQVAGTDDYSRDAVLLPLINAAVTTHKVGTGNLEPGRMQQTFDRSGNLGGFSTGGGPTSVDQNYPNESVINALRDLTGIDEFKYDEQRWRDWYVENYTLYDVDVRGE